MVQFASALAQAFDRTHSQLMDLAAAAPSSRALVEYRKRPIDFAVEKLGIPRYRLVWSENAGFIEALNKRVFYDKNPAKPDGPMIARTGWDGTPDPIAAFLQAVADEMHVCVEAGTGTQKSYTFAILVLWFLACWEGAIVKSYAPTEDQLRDYMWKEIRGLWPRFQLLFPEAKLLDLEIRMRGGMDNSWGAMGVSVKLRAGETSAVGAQGAHAPHMLLIHEEGPGIDPAVYTATEQTCTAPHNLRVAGGNPDHQLDPLHTFGYDTKGRPRFRTVCIRISALDHPNYVLDDPEIVPGAASRISIRSREEKYVTMVPGEDGKALRVEGRLFESRVRGMSPAEAAEALIKLAWVEAAMQRWHDKQTRDILEAVGKGKKALGVDVANSQAGDNGAISEWKGAVCVNITAKPCPNSNNLGFEVHNKIKDEGIEPYHVGVDDVGVGAGCYNELLSHNHVCMQASGGAIGLPYPMTERCNNRRSEMYWLFREDLRLGNIALPPNEKLKQQAIMPTWEPRNSVVCVESKEDIKDRTPDRESPNELDAVVYGNAARARDPVVQAPPKNRGETLTQREWRNAHELDHPTKKKYYGTMRQ